MVEDMTQFLLSKQQNMP